MANKTELNSLLNQIIKLIYEAKDEGITGVSLCKRLNINRQKFNYHIQQILNVHQNKLIRLKQGKTHLYKIKEDILEEHIKYFNDCKHSYEELIIKNYYKSISNEENKKICEYELNRLNEKSYLDFNKSFFMLDNPFLDSDLKLKEYMLIQTLLEAKEKRYCVNLKMKHSPEINNAIFLMIVYSDKNFYALIKEEEQTNLKRISFIESINISTKRHYFDEYDSVKRKLSKMNNSLSLYDVEPKIAILQIHKSIEKYFQDDMKNFFKHQVIKSYNPLTIEVKYTRDLEILRFVRTWLPYIKIIQPSSLITKHLQSLNQAIKDY
ncbi:hypothetical protein [Campylobacter canadensis]|uniref:WYL domain-containing protein n=1 Tax=Campylobacter canadensis TaxID=449520 RepID=A0ABS7WRR5_9BACT|nr:hypothetical protein [Campylobacter canadensis]MBZ7987437.1 WYL domain-containing protein [Campylobacter canadensis]MBZ7996765.1 WYL domain-containing protein [Campylobacter canadensis]MBZ7998632.1 WYL domain-containing protein [Campylobacter canadensis]MBZ8000715.1 WYL domain-containing protein [Campylobacter canadensis]MBZ8002002.1 WYL domain-containing protein [Campylobacter canadensis]